MKASERGKARAFLTAAVLLSTLALVAGINPEHGPGTYRTDPATVERFDEADGTHVIERTQDVWHDHPPVRLTVALIFFGIGLGLLALPAVPIAAKRRRPENRLGAADAAEGGAT